MFHLMPIVRDEEFSEEFPTKNLSFLFKVFGLHKHENKEHDHHHHEQESASLLSNQWKILLAVSS